VTPSTGLVRQDSMPRISDALKEEISRHRLL
jgi:hypothetical protein